MNLNVNYIIDHLFQKQALEDVDVRDIELVSEKYPYYAPVQYLLTKKYQQLGSEQYNEQAKKAALYFTNPHWYSALLHPDELPDGEMIYAKKEAIAIVDTPVEQQVIENNSEENIAEIETQFTIEEKPPVVSEIINDAVLTEPAEDVLYDKVIAAEEVEVTEPGEVLPVVEIKDHDTIVESIIEGEDVNPEGKDEGSIDPIEEEHLPGDIKLPTGDFSLAAAKAAFTQPLPDNIKAEDAIIPIEPLHTVDYFASQGIKLSNDYPGKDELSKKLRSFTEWLKTMKKIHPEKLEAAMDGSAQATIQHIAEHSNEQKDTVTEAMAEVYARQGLTRKAIETYQKLSLLNPDKRVYFAAKISKLNEK